MLLQREETIKALLAEINYPAEGLITFNFHVRLVRK
jgi:hypothetical protein